MHRHRVPLEPRDAFKLGDKKSCFATTAVALHRVVTGSDDKELRDIMHPIKEEMKERLAHARSARINVQVV